MLPFPSNCAQLVDAPGLVVSVASRFPVPGAFASMVVLAGEDESVAVNRLVKFKTGRCVLAVPLRATV